MREESSRRDFLKTTGSTAAMVATGTGCSSAGDQQAKRLDLKKGQLEAEIRKRADHYLDQRFLVVDYYRIRRKLAYALPVSSLSLPTVQVPSIDNYPWATWMTWELEERVNALGWAAEWFEDRRAAEAATRDLEALAQWSAYRQYSPPDLSSGHAGRILWTASMKWKWISSELRQQLSDGCRRHVEEIHPVALEHYSGITSVADIRSLDQPHRKLHNIALIGSIGAALTGSVVNHPSVSKLNQIVTTLFEANLEFREAGFTEGVAYDGYVLDFIADWLELLTDSERSSILDHPALDQFLEESYLLGAPGGAARVAELGDVEPKEMPFHISSQAKLEHFQTNPIRAWHLKRWRLDWIPAAGLGAMHPLIDSISGKTPPDGAANAHYAVVLRNGWDGDGLAAVVSCVTSAMGHLQKDNGTILIGAAGDWLITDPGYQQYIRDQEREFTLGPTAHNYPVINSLTQSQKSPRLLALERVSDNTLKTEIDLTSCYPEEAGIGSVVRTVWLAGRTLVVVADRISGEGIDSLRYHWHGHRSASWWAEDGWALIHSSKANLWLTSPYFPISGANIKRLPGSRGQLTLVVETDSPAKTVWWLAVVGEAPKPYRLNPADTELEVGGDRFTLS